MSGTIEVLLKPESVIGPHENSQDSLDVFQLSILNLDTPRKIAAKAL